MQNPKYKAIFFDLDGTLLPMDMDEFMSQYMRAIEEHISVRKGNVELFHEGLNKGIHAMAADDSQNTNEFIFWESFFSHVLEDKKTWMACLEEFYERKFGEIGKKLAPNPSAARVVQILEDKGYPLVLTTMPMFPRRAIEWRCAWAGLDHRVFSRITSFENSTSVKPKLSYYRENLRACNLAPDEVLMVGNNTKEDLACLELGMDAYLVTDFLIHKNEFDLDSVKKGSLKEFELWADSLEACESPAREIIPGLVG